MEPSKNLRRFQPAFLILGSVLLLLLWTFIPFKFHLGIIHVKKIDFLSGLRDRGKEPERFGPLMAALKKFFREASPVASVEIKSTNIKPAQNTSPIDFAANPMTQPLELFDEQALDPFNKALHELAHKDGVVRIAYFGDSIIEGDLITQDLRLNLQKAFGGSGVGYIPITSEVAQFRITVGHTFSSDWQTVSLLNNNRRMPLGIAGFVFIPHCQRDDNNEFACSSWVEYRVSSSLETLSKIQKLKLFYSHAEAPASVDYGLDGSEPRSAELVPGEDVQQTVIEAEPPAKKIRLTFNAKNPFYIYGASWESEKGIVLDNFALRSHSGLALSEIPESKLLEFNRLLEYKLIILHYGLNVSSPEHQDFSWYQVGMEKVIDYLKSCFPEAALLLVGVPDRSYKQETQYVTMPSIPRLAESQRMAAHKTGIAFWDLYSAMGGYNSMVQWVNHQPSLAALDYTHLNYLGSKRIADHLYRALMSQYKTYEEHHVE